MKPKASHRTRAALTTAFAFLLFSAASQAQPTDGPQPPDPGAIPAIPPPTKAPGASVVISDNWKGAVRVLRIPGAAGTNAAEAKAAAEIFPGADKVWMHVFGTDPRPIEGARRGARNWVCSGGCELTLPTGSTTGTTGEGSFQQADVMLRSIKAQTPTQPLPLTIWQPGGSAAAAGKLLFDPVLLGRRSYRHMCAYRPIKQRAKPNDVVPLCPNERPSTPTPNSAELRLGLQWPRASEMAHFQYIAITDACGNARVQPYQRYFSVPVYHVASGACGKADGRVLRVFPSGGWIRITGFNLDAPAAGNVVSVTFRVSVPPLEDVVSADGPALLFPDPGADDLIVDCGPVMRKARRGRGGIPPRGSRGKRRPGQKTPPGKSLPGQKTPPGKSLPGQKPPPGHGPAPSKGKQAPPKAAAPKVPIVRRRRSIPASTPNGQPMQHQGLIIGPEPLRRGNCRIMLTGQTKRRLVAPLALRVRLTRTDIATKTHLINDKPWIVTPNNAVFRLPPLSADFSGESRLVLEVYSDPKSAEGNVVLLSDAARYSRKTKSGATDTQLRRLIGSVTIYSAPLCGESNFETVEGAGSCFRGYFTVPAMLATLQITRAPWVERPLITRSILSAVGIAFAMDSYDPVEREAFPIAFQVGGFVQDLGDSRLGLMTYIGVAPTVPILGEGGNTTSIGLLAGLGMNYITRSNGPDEGFKPAAFVSVVVQVGQANPAAKDDAHTMGKFAPTAATGAGTY